MDECREVQGDEGNQFPQLAEIHLLSESRTRRFRHNSNTHATHTQYEKDSQGGLGNAGALLSMLCFSHSFIKLTGQLYAQ